MHDEPVLRFSIFDQLFRAPDAFALSTPEEIELIARRFHVDPVGAVIGIGVEQTRVTYSRFATRIPPSPARRISSTSGAWTQGRVRSSSTGNFVEYKRRNPSRLQLVYLGDAITTLPDHPDVLVTGFVGDNVRDAAVAGARPGAAVVLRVVLDDPDGGVRASPRPRSSKRGAKCSKATRSGATPQFRIATRRSSRPRSGCWSSGPAWRTRWAPTGGRYVEAHYRWNDVLDRYEALLEDVASRRPLARRAHAGRSLRSTEI